MRTLTLPLPQGGRGEEWVIINVAWYHIVCPAWPVFVIANPRQGVKQSRAFSKNAPFLDRHAGFRPLAPAPAKAGDDESGRQKAATLTSRGFSGQYSLSITTDAVILERETEEVLRA